MWPNPGRIPPYASSVYPVLRLGRFTSKDKLNFNFVYGFRYLLIPKLALGGDVKDILTILGAKDRKEHQKLDQEAKGVYWQMKETSWIS